MTILIIIVIYALGVLYCKWMNFLLVKNDKYAPIVWGIWLIPVVGPIVFLILYLSEVALKDASKKYKFFGKNWRS